MEEARQERALVATFWGLTCVQEAVCSGGGVAPVSCANETGDFIGTRRAAHGLPLVGLSLRQQRKLVAQQRGPCPTQPFLLWPFLPLGRFVPFLDCANI